MVMDITYCSFFFDIGRGAWDTFTVHNNTYMHWFKNFLSLNVNLYIKTEEQFIPFIKEHRKKIDPEFKKTILEVAKIEDLEAYKLYNSRLEELMFSEEFKKKMHHNQVPEMTKPLYNVLMFDKVCFLKDIITKNPFNTKFFSWVDTGFVRDESWVRNNSEWPDPSKLLLKENKVRFFCINDNVQGTLRDKEYHCLSQIRLLKGTNFYLDGKCINELYDLFHKKVNECLNNKFIGSDEKIFDLCYLEKPDLFELVKCDWREEFNLYSRTRKSTHKLTLKWNAEDITKCGDYAFWYIGVEDRTTAVIHRADLDPVRNRDYFEFKTNSIDVCFESLAEPYRFIIWPVSKSKGWLDRKEYLLKP
ncbi:MAG: hypothetical protein EBU90_15760 [Proteobacteria bacterium]|nr:hypothetical protein [Pseudomonadota bacterium]